MQYHQPESWHDQPLSALTTALHTDAVRGLAPQEAAARLHQWGPNALREGQALSPLVLIAGQFRSLVIWVLIGAALVSVALGEVADGVAILAIVLLKNDPSKG
jgi:Ca2+-transporting ATPase